VRGAKISCHQSTAAAPLLQIRWKITVARVVSCLSVSHPFRPPPASRCPSFVHVSFVHVSTLLRAALQMPHWGPSFVEK
jgi:hypothetical protein